MTHVFNQINFSQDSAYLVEASAGTGKTWTLERLFIKALIAGKRVDQILVVTFTTDAANELKTRIYKQINLTLEYLISGQIKDRDVLVEYLDEFNSEEQKAKIIQDLFSATQNFDLAAISTIHSFCRNILSENALKCNFYTNFKLVDNKKTIYHGLVADFIRYKIMSDAKAATMLKNLNELFKDTNYDNTLIDKITNKLPNDLIQVKNGVFCLKYSYDNQAHSLGLELLMADSLEKKQQILAKADFLWEIFQYIEIRYCEEFANSNLVSFDDLITIVSDTILSNPVFAEELFKKHPIAFIDEFQDTDNSQWDIFSNIYQIKNGACRGNVVLVGDPKQAIYRFRGADVDTYLLAKNSIKPSHQLKLDANFRSNVGIVTFVNQLFHKDNQVDGFLGFGIEHYDVHAKAQKSDVEIPSVDSLKQLTNHKHDFYSDAVQIEVIKYQTTAAGKAQMLNSIALEILSLLKAEPKLVGEIAILVTDSYEAVEITSHLRKYNLKVTEQKLGSIFSSSIALDVYNLLNSIADFRNSSLFSKAVCGNLFNLNLAEVSFKMTEGNQGESSQLIALLQEKFAIYSQIWQDKGIINLTYALINDLSVEFAKQWTNRELSDLWQLVELINQHNTSTGNYHELIHWLGNKIEETKQSLTSDEDAKEAEKIRLDTDDEQIIITTQHGSKGMEYEILFCPYFKSEAKLNSGHKFNLPMIKTYRNQQDKQVSQIITDEATGHSIIEKDNTETQRLNYVALTRAKQRLYLYLLAQNGGSYWKTTKPPLLNKLFGYQATEHKLFNFSKLFSANMLDGVLKPMQGVVIYERKAVSELDLLDLRFEPLAKTTANKNTLALVNNIDITRLQDISWQQSYSGISRQQRVEEVVEYKISSDNDKLAEDLSSDNEIVENITTQYHDEVMSEVRGAAFGNLFHELCENYPLDTHKINRVAAKHLSLIQLSKYSVELNDIIEKTFNHPILADTTLDKLHKNNRMQSELEFNFVVHNKLDFADKLYVLFVEHYGAEHEFSEYVQRLIGIDKGFLNGFIDVVFLDDTGKYWVLDYKTNTLDDYSTDSLRTSIAHHHYYLQYLLYLVALRRYLQLRFADKYSDDLLGGAIYFYVRGLFITSSATNATFIDDKCISLVAKLDALLLEASNV